MSYTLLILDCYPLSIFISKKNSKSPYFFFIILPLLLRFDELDFFLLFGLLVLVLFLLTVVFPLLLLLVLLMLLVAEPVFLDLVLLTLVLDLVAFGFVLFARVETEPLDLFTGLFAAFETSPSLVIVLVLVFIFLTAGVVRLGLLYSVFDFTSFEVCGR